MGIKFGEVDAMQIVDNEYRAKLALKILDWMINNGPPSNRPQPEQITQWQNEVLRELQQKYPNSGIQLTR